MKILVSGCAGFIGSNLCEKLISEGHSIVGVDNLSHGNIDNIDSFRRNISFEWHIDNVQDFRTTESFDIVIHLASEKIPRKSDSYMTIRDNQSMLEIMTDIAISRKARFLFASTSDVYGKSKELPFKEDSDLIMGNTTVKRWSYAVSKMHSEHYIQACHEKHGLDYTIFRLFSCYGRHQAEGWWGGVQSAFIDNVLMGRELVIDGGGFQSRCFTYIDDAIDGIMRCVHKEESINQIFNIGNPTTGISVQDLADKIIYLTGKHVPIIMAPYDTNRYEDSISKVPDISKAQTMLGYYPKWGLNEGLTETIKWRKTTIYGKSSSSDSNV